jgi:hypothetical protein
MHGTKMTAYQSEAGNNTLISERKNEIGFKSSSHGLLQKTKTTHIGGRSMSINTDNQTDTEHYRINKSFSKSFLVETGKEIENYNSANGPTTP